MLQKMVRVGNVAYPTSFSAAGNTSSRSALVNFHCNRAFLGEVVDQAEARLPSNNASHK
jgi:hypothetical protein